MCFYGIFCLKSFAGLWLVFKNYMNFRLNQNKHKWITSKFQITNFIYKIQILLKYVSSLNDILKQLPTLFKIGPSLRTANSYFYAYYSIDKFQPSLMREIYKLAFRNHKKLRSSYRFLNLKLYLRNLYELSISNATEVLRIINFFISLRK